MSAVVVLKCLKNTVGREFNVLGFPAVNELFSVPVKTFVRAHSIQFNSVLFI